MNNITRTILPVLSVLLASGCVIDARERDTLIEPVRTVDRVLDAGQPIRIRVPAAQLRIVNADDNRLTGEMRIFCPDAASQCAEKLRDNEFVLSERDGELQLRLTHNGSWRYRNGEVEIDLAVPAGHPITLDVTAGAVDVKVANCLTVDMEAGDAQFELPLAMVASVELDAGVGDAGLYIDDRWVGGERSLLVGAEAHWRGGDGDCDVVIDLQAGDLRLDLVSDRSRSVERIADREAQ